VAALLLGPVGFAAGIGVVTAVRGLAPGNQGHFERQGGYRLTQPLLDYEAAQHIEAAAPFLKQKIEALINETRRAGRAHHVSVYFRDLANGPWFGIHEREPFTPASLLKVPILMAYLKLAESDPGLLSRPLAYHGEARLPEAVVSPSRLIEPGTPYAIEELLERMIVQSDNRATNALVTALDEAALHQTFTSLGVPVPDERTLDDLITVKAYATFFRILFNATYLSPAMSEQALEWLATSEFTDGLVAGVPAGVVVAHKFGERSAAGAWTTQLHDCGIVYCPQRPYLLCVMTRGDQVDALSGTIRDISRLVYGGICGG